MRAWGGEVDSSVAHRATTRRHAQHVAGSRARPAAGLCNGHRRLGTYIVRATAWTLHDAAQKAKGRLCGKRAGSPAALG